MKLTALLILIACLQVSARGDAQITLSETGAPLKKILEQIEKQSGYLFWYNNSVLEHSKPVTIHIKNASLEQALALCFRDQLLTYTIVDKVIVIKTGDKIAPPAGIDIQGIVTDDAGKPLEGASIELKGTGRGTYTDAAGKFELKNVDENGTLIIQFTGYQGQEIRLTGQTYVISKLSIAVKSLTDVNVQVSTGYQIIPKERVTGSFTVIGNELFNRSVSVNFLDRLEGVTSGLLFNKNKTSTANESAIMIRGRSTIFAQTDPLIVIDNFPYDGNLNNINPNDIESITILKDAAASSIWGVRSGNGVIVVTTKSGKYNQSLKIAVNSSIMVGKKPDLYYQPVLGASEYVDLELFLNTKGYYTARMNNAYQSLSPVAQILLKRKTGQISAADSVSQINALRSVDMRDDLSRYFYRKSVTQQYFLNLKGGSATNQYYLSAGYDKGIYSLIGSEYKRITINAKNTYSSPNKRLQFFSNLVFSSSRTQNGYLVNSNFPIYTRLVDNNGNAVPVYNQLYRKSYLDTIGGGMLLDWTYKPYDELHSKNDRTLISDYRILTGLKYKIIKDFDISLNYQYGKGVSESSEFQDQSSYYVRNLINTYTQLDYQTKNPSRPVPLGAILDAGQTTYSSHNLRAQLNYSTQWGKNHEINAIAGAEIKKYQAASSAIRRYGYNQNNATEIPVSYVTQYSTLPTGTMATILNFSSINNLTDRYVSYFGNAAYTYKQRYTISFSARRDESNLFGVEANQKGVPLWSVGGSWKISREKFLKSRWLSFLNLRITDGYNGNVDKTTTAFTTAQVSGMNVFGSPSAILINPPNPQLRWEKINILNFGLDFSIKNGVLSGSVEYYQKAGKDLIGNLQVAPQTGVTQVKKNIANIKGKGVDIVLNAIILNKALRWEMNFLYSYASDVVCKYKLKQSTAKGYLSNNGSNPLEGKPWAAMFAYKWAGLNPQTGDPQGILNGQISNDYSKLINPAAVEDMVYIGSARPTSFGSVRNTISFKELSFSFNIVYKLGYYFRRPSINYTNLVAASLVYGVYGHADYSKRWQKPGDENHTIVPSFVYPVNASRDEFYLNSEALIEKGDHIRLQDMQLSYDLPSTWLKKIHIQSLRVYLYSNNVGMLWKKNKAGLDPDYVVAGNVIGPSLPAPRTVAIGIKTDF